MADDDLIVRVGADFDDLRKGLNKAGEEVDGFSRDAEQASKKVSKGFNNIAKAARVAAVGVAALGAATAVVVTKQIQAAVATKRWADQLDISAGEFSKLAAVARQFGATTDDVGDAIKDLNERISDAAKNGGEMGEVIRELGLNAEDLLKLPLEEQFLKVADAIGKMKNAGDQNRATAVLMADAGFRLLPVFRQGEKTIREMADALEENNTALDEFELEKLNEINNEWIEMGQSLEGLANTVVLKLAPAIKTMNGLLKDANEFWRGSEPTMEEYKERLAEIEQELQKNQKTYQFYLEGGKLTPWDNPKKKAKEYAQTLSDLVVEQFKVNEALAKMGEEQEKKDKPIKLEPQEMTGLTGPSLLEKYLADQAKIRKHARDTDIDKASEYNDTMMEMEKNAARQNVLIWESGLKGRAEITSKILGDISGLMNSKSRKMFEIGKAAAIAQVAIDTPKAAMSAYSAMAGIPYVGPALGIAAAAAAVANGASQIQNIQSQSFGGGGASASGGFSEGSGAAAGAAVDEEPTNVIDATFNLQGEGPVSQEQIRGLASGLNDFVKDGGQIRSVSVR